MCVCVCVCVCVHQLELDGKVGCLHLLLSPDQIIHLTDLMAALCIDTGTDDRLYSLGTDYGLTSTQRKDHADASTQSFMVLRQVLVSGPITAPCGCVALDGR